MIVANRIAWHNESRRLLSVVIAGALTSWALFFVMQALVSVSFKELVPSKVIKVDWTRLILDKPVDEIEHELKRAKLPEPPPPAPPFEPTRALDPGAGIQDVFVPGNVLHEFASASKDAGVGLPSSTATPLVRVDPNYPPRARQQGIEGFVVVAFSITSAGTIADAKVVNSEPPAVFDREAIRAVQKWRYNPIEGEAASPTRQTVRLQFELPKDGRR